MASNVPKFTSFRPKPKPAAEAPKEQEKAPSKSNVSRPSKEKGRENSGPRSNHGEERPRKDRASTVRHEDEGRLQARDAGPSKLFFSDRRGDPDIVKYGSLNRYDIPAYHNYGYGCILGLSPDRRIDRDRSADKYIVVTPARRRRDERLLMSKHINKEDRRNIRFLKTEDEAPNIDADFIPISATGKRKREEEGDRNDDEDDYRGFKREASDARPSDPDAEYESDTLVSSADAEVTRRNAEMARRTHEHPGDVQAWLDLAQHQEAMIRIDCSSSELSSSDKAHLADVRISTYEQALKKIGNDEASLVKLYAALMSEATRSWDSWRLTSKWTEILAKFPSNEELWMQYLNFVQSNFTSFKYESCRSAFLKCLNTMRAGSSQASAGLLLYILVRLTAMVQEAGYQELAIAAWQALLEFHLLNPKSLDHEVELRRFEEFWESEQPRLGEVGAKGWGVFNPDNAPSQPTNAVSLVEKGPSDSVFGDFRKRELDSTIKLRYPGRTMDEVGEDDAFHTILYSDIEEYLQVIPRGTPKSMVLSAFLRFCRLPVLVGPGSGAPGWPADPFLQSEFRNPYQQEAATHFAQSLANYASCPLDAFQMTTELLFERGFPDAIGPVDAAFVRRILKLLVADVASDESIGEYLLAFESKFFPAEAFKTAKKLLKARSSSLRLYNAYGLVESRCGNSPKADQVFSAALSMRKGESTHIAPDTLDLFANWVWEALRRGENKQGLWRLVSPTGQVSKAFATQEGPDQGALLRARSTLSNTSERALLNNDYPAAVKATSLLAVLGYLSGGGDVESTLAVHNRLTTWFSQHKLFTSPAAELHAQSIAQLLTYHATHARIVKPSLLRLALEPLIAMFPNNTILLSLYSANETRFSIDDRVRAIMHQSVLSETKERKVAGWAFAIHFETLRGEIAGSTSHSIRALFKKAEDDVGAHCPALWKHHVMFELEEARMERAKRPSKKPKRDGKKRKDESRVEEAYRRVKETLFKGMTQLPWCKDYMMMAFTHLGEEFLSDEDLRKVYNVMVEKELRLYIELEDDGA
ncbi:DUF1740-domain-containing protein [Lentithecium fluviatile CBS 122367]|uniref:DUF1740-domain-containing protein n=1 Tax=Lentithecium fluviatile CBS 122367 TaxID=1168545 RepID=A0A6G1IHH5_9PLEO|nr:DUF1740-domain-containing protein [Lentithecium fluviatile CBS 122367]